MKKKTRNFLEGGYKRFEPRDETDGKVGWYCVIVNDRRTRVYAHHERPDIILQAYMTLSEPTRDQAVVLFSSEPAKAKQLAEDVLNVVRS